MPPKKATKKKPKKGGAAGDAWPGERIAGPVIPAMSSSYSSDGGIASSMQYQNTAAQLAAVNIFQGGKKQKKKIRPKK